jgi:hypothetical protein
LSKSTVLDMARKKQIPHVRFSKRKVFFNPERLQRWIVERGIEPDGTGGNN